jgi:hypothetical protein
MRLVVAKEMADQRTGDAKLHVGVEIGVVVGIDLADQGFEAGLED